MEKGKKNRRYIALIVLVIIGALLYAMRLFNLQIVNGEKYSKMADRRAYYTTPTKAIRGEILDRYGRPLVINRMGFSVKLDKTKLGNNDLNEVILSVLSLFEAEQKGSYLDKLPISSDEKPSFLFDLNNAEDATYQKFLKFLQQKDISWSDEPKDILSALCTSYKINENLPEKEKRKIVGVRYDMEQLGFSRSAPFTFFQDVDIEMVTKLRENNVEYPGIYIDEEAIREYVAGTTASHLLGTVGVIYKEEYPEYKEKGYQMDDTVGRDGVEKAFEEYLRGENGLRTIEQSLSDPLDVKISEKETVPGKNVVLTIDSRLQSVTEESLARTIQNIADKGTPGKRNGADADAGAAVVIEVKTGAILASASYPGFDLSTFLKDYNSLLQNPAKPLFNRSISGAYPPGSTFKMVTAVAALQEGIIDRNTTITDKGIYEYYAPSYRPRCWIYTDYGRTHGTINVEGAIKGSCNYFFYEMGRLLGIDRLNEYERAFGLGEYTGIEVAGENPGILAGKDYRRENNKSPWQPADTIQAAIGQADNQFTPIQLANYIATLTNGGTRYETHLLKEVRDSISGELVLEKEPKVMSTISMSLENYETVMNGMRSVTEDGTASNVFGTYPIKVGGKTGTAQAGGNGSAHGVFVAFAPFEDPEIAVAVVVEHGAHGNTVAPVAKDIFDAYFFSPDSGDKVVSENVLIP